MKLAKNLALFALLATLFPLGSWGACTQSATISGTWEQVICPNTANQRTTTKNTNYSIFYGVPGCETSTSGGGGTVPPVGGVTGGGGGGGGGGQSGGGGGGGGGAPSLIDSSSCFTPVCSGGACEDECRECTGSSVIMSMGTYETSQADLSVPGRGIPVTWERNYRSNIIVPPPPEPVRMLSGTSSSGGSGSGTAVSPTSTYARTVSSNSGMLSFHVPEDGPLGFGWTNEFLVSAFQDTYIDEQGRHITFTADAEGHLLTDTATGLTLKPIRIEDLHNESVGSTSGAMLPGSGTSSASGTAGTVYVPLSIPIGYDLHQRGGVTRHFDSRGRLITVTDPQGNRLTVLYNAGGRISGVQDASGRQVLTFAYLDDDYRIDSVTDLAGRTVAYRYDAFGHLIEVTDPAGGVTTYTYNAYHGLLTKTNPLGETYTVTYKYPDRGVTEKVIDPVGSQLLSEGKPIEGHVQTFLYDFQGKIFRIKDQNGYERKKVVNDKGLLVAEYELSGAEPTLLRKVEYPSEREEIHTDAAGNVTRISRNEWRDITRSTDGEGRSTQIVWNNQQRPAQITDPLGVVTRFEYDETGTLLLTKIEAQGKSEERRTSYTYDEHGQLLTVTVAGATTSLSYNDVGQPLSLTDPLGNVSRLEYDAAGNITGAVDANGNRTVITYDDLGHPVTVKDPLGHITTLNYNAAGRLDTITDPLQRVTSVETDFKERISAVVDALNRRQEFVYDGVGNLVQHRDGDVVTTFAYDSSKRLTAVTDAEGNTTSYSYAGTGCSTCGGSSDIPKQIVDPFGAVTEHLFDKAGRVTGVQDPLQNLTHLAYDARGQVIRQADGNGNATSFAYDALGRLIRQTDAAGGVTSFTYDQRNNLLSLTDPEQNTTTFAYDLADRKIRETRPMGQATEYVYYPNGLLKTVKDAKGQTTSYHYDEAGRLSEVLYADNQKDTFAYDAVGNLTGWSGADGVTGAMTFDALDRKLSETVGYGGITKSYSYSYDAYGNKVTYTSPEGVEHSYSYDKLGRPKTITFAGQTVSYTYDKTRLKEVLFPNGVTTSYAYNAASWLSGIDTVGPRGAVFSRTYSFDNVGNIASHQGQDGLTSYGYDPTYQLTGADHPTQPDEAFTYDKVGNRLSSLDGAGRINYNDNNELIGSSGIVYEYDANGNTTKKTVTVGTNIQVTIYEYNARNRLSRVYLPDGRVASYSYDPFGRRVKKQVGNEVAYFVYADEGLVGEYDASGADQKNYGWKPNGLWGTDPVYMVEGGNAYFYHNDHLGTPQRLTDQLDNVVWGAQYSAFGLATIDPASTVVSNLRYPGQYFDAETGLNYNWNRFYDSQSGRYTQIDPIGFAAGDKNLYRYVQNNSQRGFDPEGLYDFDELLRDSGDFFAGFGDTITFNGTKWVRDQMNKTYGWSDSVNKCSGVYTTGKFAGVAWWTAFAGVSTYGGASLEGLGRLKAPIQFVRDNVFRWEKGRFKVKGVWQDSWHFHLGPNPAMNKTHLPYQFRPWYYETKSTLKRILTGVIR